MLKNASGEVFIPGTAIAGAMRNYLGLDKNKNCVFGYADGENGKMSSLFISDAYIQKLDIKNDENKKYSISVRDGVGLTEGKTAIPGAKYDYEVVETGKAVIHIEKVIRAQNEEIQTELKKSGNYCQPYSREQFVLALRKTAGWDD